MNALGVRPSFATGFAYNAGESEYPELWKGLVGFWPIFLGQTGNKVFDLSGNGSHGTIGSNIVWVPTPDGWGLEFFTNDKIVISNPSPALRSDSVTIVMRLYMGGVSSSSLGTVWFTNKTSTRNRWMLGDTGGSTLQYDTAGAGHNETVAGLYTMNVWMDVAFSLDGATAKHYVDGVLKATSVEGTAPIATGTGDIWIGIGQDNNAFRFDGIISHIFAYDRILSASEIAFLSSNRTALVQLRRRVVMVSVGVAVGEDFFRTIEDGVGIVDSMSRIQDLSRTITDGVGTADTIGRTQVQLRTLAETLGLTDAIWKAETRIFADAVGIADSVTKAQVFARTIADDIGLIDSESELMTYVRTLAETLGITDVMSKTVGFPRTISDDVGITDSVTRTAAFARVVAEAIGIADVVTKTQVQLRTIADTMGLTDAMTPGQLIVFVETMGITDTMTHTKTQIRTFAETMGITDDLTRIAAYVFTQTDDIGIGDAMVRVAVALRTISDDVGMTDTMSSISELVKAAWAFMLLKKSN